MNLHVDMEHHRHVLIVRLSGSWIIIRPIMSGCSWMKPFRDVKQNTWC